MGLHYRVKDGVQTRVGPRGTTHRARVKVLGHVTYGPWRRDRREALEDRDRLRHERHAEASQPQESITLRRGMELVMAELQRRKRKDATIVDREQRFDLLRRLFDEDALLDEITPQDIERYVDVRLKGIPEDDVKPVGVATADADIRALNTVFTLALRSGNARQNPIKRARIPKPERHPNIDWFTGDELAELLRAMRKWKPTKRLDPRRDADIAELIALTGWRLTEGSLIQMADVSIPKRVVMVHDGKTGRRAARINPEAMRIIERWKAERPRGRLFPISASGIESMLQRWSTRLDEPRLHAHALRHTHGTALAAAGMTAHALARAMGHASMSTSLIYVHLAGHDEDALTNLTFRRDDEADPDPEADGTAEAPAP